MPTDPRPYWYFVTEEYCPACSRSQRYLERRYTPRPERWEDRHEAIEVYDYCD